ncbi:hypothetical protein OG432_22240 [Streptomyces sp. NBC_00442]|uniref:hypothetical protein n=1 Tax=Streptomyces sp. NBC_00442 TaxID=2903651 RepID=UPI002E1CFD71
MADGEDRPAWGQLVAGPALALRVTHDGGRTWQPYVMPHPPTPWRGRATANEADVEVAGRRGHLAAGRE